MFALWGLIRDGVCAVASAYHQWAAQVRESAAIQSELNARAREAFGLPPPKEEGSAEVEAQPAVNGRGRKLAAK